MYEISNHNNSNMNKTNETNKVRAYAAPALTVLEVNVEGVLCQSGDLTIKDWGTDNDGLEC